ncbi:hypothetical protein KC19_5G012400 [Ceratodon purpureus]|uniref:Uncharacterized protein n=1 Tax=Ceratodon purpureus TaxID=3225 RepID=A0A8T0HY17_CERPU|nr:hypothetical protein KC19_5G012400 [Ceratodon purpureus]
MGPNARLGLSLWTTWKCLIRSSVVLTSVASCRCITSFVCKAECIILASRQSFM